MNNIRFLITALAIALGLSVASAQSGFMLNTNNGDHHYVNSEELTFTVDADGTHYLSTGSATFPLSDIESLEPYPVHVVNGTEASLSSPWSSGCDTYFVGAWQGQCHTIGTKTSPHPGIWQFRNDGTFQWNATDITHSCKGNWWLDSDAGIIITDATNCPALKIVSKTDDMILLENSTYSEYHTLTRYESEEYEWSLNTPHVIEYRPDGFVVRTTFNNRLFVNLQSFKTGVAWASSATPEDFTLVYAADYAVSQQGAGEGWNFVGEYICNNRPKILDTTDSRVSLSGFSAGDKIIIKSFCQTEDGTTVYGPSLNVCVITPPVDGIFLGEELIDGYVTFWYNQPIDETGSVSSSYSYMSPENAETALANLNRRSSVTWEFPDEKSMGYIKDFSRWNVNSPSQYFKYYGVDLFSPYTHISLPTLLRCNEDWMASTSYTTYYRCMLLYKYSGDDYYQYRGNYYNAAFGVSVYYADEEDVIDMNYGLAASLVSDVSSGCFLPCIKMKVLWE